MSLKAEHLDKIRADFDDEMVARVISELERLTPAQTWDSEINLTNTIGAILSLSKSDFEKLTSLVDAGLIDFRDVIYWWTLEQKKNSKGV